MKNAPRVLGTLSLLAALGSVTLQIIVVVRLWAVFVETLPLKSTLALSTASAVLGLALAIVAVILRRGSVGLLQSRPSRGLRVSLRRPLTA